MDCEKKKNRGKYLISKSVKSPIYNDLSYPIMDIKSSYDRTYYLASNQVKEKEKAVSKLSAI
ncbi:hypothetical protein DASC09_004380 [Saccharomycopsis crataegensis]|uniref:Uncharacterized protein n=1 Tax=Saccharomycopsis crataegensis TaxID=43959 RepID=A0AAV5QED7_9ASCO|nr:hypothetical protein DASC09_004380 [Saccharomycopsis crataegensis]